MEVCVGLSVLSSIRHGAGDIADSRALFGSICDIAYDGADFSNQVNHMSTVRTASAPGATHWVSHLNCCLSDSF